METIPPGTQSVRKEPTMADKDRDHWPTSCDEAEEERDEEREQTDEYQRSAMRDWFEGGIYDR